MSNFFIIKNTDQLKNGQAWLAKLHNQYGWIKVMVQTEKRSLSKNALAHVWFKEIASQTGCTENEAKAQCKLEFGVPLLRTEDAKFNAWCERVLDGLSYQARLAAMRYFPVSSIMDEKQMHEYLQRISVAYAQRGIILTTMRDF